MNEPPHVSIFWDAAAKPEAKFSGFEVVEAIRAVAKPLGFVKTFKLYADIAGFDALSHDFRFEVQCSGVTLVDTASSGRLSSATKMIIVDSFIQALDNPASCILILTVDPDICYGISLLRLRGYRVFILSPPECHTSLGRFSMDGGWDNSMLSSERIQETVEKPQVSGHIHRQSGRVPVQPSESIHDLSEQDILPTPTIQAFREQFAANSSPRAPSIAVNRGNRPARTSRTRTVSLSRSSSSDSVDCVFPTFKARVETEDEDDGDYVALAPPNRIKEETTDSKGKSDQITRTFSSNSHSSGFSLLSSTLPTEPTRNDAGSSGNDTTGTSTNAPPSINNQKAASKESVGPPPSSDRTHPSTQETTNAAQVTTLDNRQDLSLHVPQSVTEVQHPTPRRSTFPSFFPPPPLSPDRTPVVPVSSLPVTRPATTMPSLDAGRVALSNNVNAVNPVVPKMPPNPTPLLAQAQQPPKPAPTPTSQSVSGPFSPPTIPAVKPVSAANNIGSPPKAPGVSTAAGPSFVLPKPAASIGPSNAARAATQPKAPSSSTSATVASSTTPLPPHFAVLVAHLKSLRDKGQKIVDRSTLGVALPKLQSNIYAQAGVSHFSKPFKRYCEAAEKAGVVVLNTADTLSLHPAYH